MDFWAFYILVYTLSAFGYLWYRYIFILAYNPKIEGDFKGKISIILPFYNEKTKLLVDAIKSINSCEGNKEIIIIDDGSTSKEGYQTLLKLKDKFSFQLIRYEGNKGKRHAQTVGFSKAKGDIIVTVDSDTILDKKALVYLTHPFSDPKVGATTGQLRIINKNKNFLTKLIAARYWNAFNFERKSQSVLGAIVCCTGPLSAYRALFIKKISKEYENQQFMGKKCTYGDDRHLTTLILKDNYKILYVENAVGYTWAMEEWKNFIKQQIRWKKSWLRETILISKFMFKKSKTLSFEILISTFITVFSLFARIGLIVTIILNPSYIFFAFLVLTIMGILHSLYILFHKPEYYFFSIAYSFVHVFLVYWTLIVALLTFKNRGWGTR